MIEKEQEEISVNTARREKARADAHWMKEVELTAVVLIKADICNL